MTAQPAMPNRQLRLFAIIFGMLVTALAAAYFLFVRADYVVLYSDLRAEEAAPLVSELDRRGVAYRLGSGGTSILVPADQADSVRVGLAGADIPNGREAGFELFDESSMGLTDFAQKINYQRALQGELARTIMTMDGVETARVHLAIPERALFRGARVEPRAAVTVIPRSGRVIDEARVAGIQRLVASTVPDLTLDNVTVLDRLGRIVSPEPSAAERGLNGPLGGMMQDEYRARVRAAIGGAVPGLVFDVQVFATPAPLAPAVAPVAADQLAQLAPPETVRARLVILTPQPVEADVRQRISAAISASVPFDEAQGDSLSFALGTSAAAPAASVAVAPLAVSPAAQESEAAAQARPLWVFDWWPVAALAGVVFVLILGWRRSAASARLEQELFVHRLRAELGSEGEPRSA